MRFSLVLLAMIVFLYVDGRETRSRDTVEYGREKRDQMVTSPVEVNEEHLTTNISNNSTEEVIIQQTDASSTTDDEDGNAGDHESNSIASIFDSFVSKKSEDESKCRTNQRCVKKGGECVQAGTCKNIVGKCNKKCICCAKPPAVELPWQGKIGAVVPQIKMNRQHSHSGLISYTGPCPGVFHDVMGTCYFFSSAYLGETWAKQSWPNSQAYCEFIGSIFGLNVGLADLGGEHCLPSHGPLLEEIAKRGEWAWLGATDEDVEGTWIWSHSGRILSLMNSYWYENQPGTTDGNCLVGVIAGTYNRAYFADWPCDKETTFICQIF